MVLDSFLGLFEVRLPCRGRAILDSVSDLTDRNIRSDNHEVGRIPRSFRKNLGIVEPGTLKFVVMGCEAA
jgi:hypothetical protein